MVSKSKKQKAAVQEDAPIQKPVPEELTSHVMGSLHYEIKKTESYFSKVYDTVKFYLDKYGPYLPADERRKLAILALESDEIMLDLQGLAHQIDIIYSEAQALIDTGEPDKFSVEPELVDQLQSASAELEERISEFMENFHRMIADLKERARRDGIY
jgi:hypothetical protein